MLETPQIELPPPQDKPFTQEELARFDGSREGYPIYVSLKGTVFDVSSKRLIYGKDCSFSCFAGKDVSKAVGLSTIKAEEISPDYSGLNKDQMKILNDWYKMYQGKYPTVGKLTDMPEAVKNMKED